ncbi:hypothetical protein RLK11_00285, partial [Streptococcus pneumoniae]|nr:hypothetical protein [Streptococcus pneumoniae]
ITTNSFFMSIPHLFVCSSSSYPSFTHKKTPAYLRGSNGRSGRFSQYSQLMSLQRSSRHSLQLAQ